MKRAADRDGSDPYTPGHGTDAFAVRHYDLALTYRPLTNRLDAHAEIHAVARRELAVVVLDLAGLDAAKVTLDGGRVKRYRQAEGKLRITPARPLAAGTGFILGVTYSGHPKPIRSRWGAVGWEELTDGVLVAGQPIGAPSWFPCNDHPRDKATYRIAITTDAPFTALANGQLVGRANKASKTTWSYEQREPMASYLATVQIGRYEIRKLPSGDVLAREFQRFLRQRGDR